MISDRRSNPTLTFAAPSAWLAILASLFAALGAWAQDAGQAGSREHQVKAAFLFNFAKYGEWPADALSWPVFRYCIAGHQEIADILTERLRGQRLHSLEVQVTAIAIDEPNNCHLIFVADSLLIEQRRQLLQATSTMPALLVGESREFLELGGAVGFFLAGGTVHFDVNLAHLQRHRIQLSSKVLRHADHVWDKSAPTNPEMSTADKPAAELRQ